MMASDTHCYAQAQHGSAPNIQGQDKANPKWIILLVAMLLSWVGRHYGRPALAHAGAAIEMAINVTLAHPSIRTPGAVQGAGLICASSWRAIHRARQPGDDPPLRLGAAVGKSACPLFRRVRHIPTFA